MNPQEAPVHFISPSFVFKSPVDTERIMLSLEEAARLCYKSEDRIAPGSAEKLIRHLLFVKKHYSILEHEIVSVQIVCDRGVSHELVRHRIAAYSQESTRYCNYGGAMQFIVPPWIVPGTRAAELWEASALHDYRTYAELLDLGWKPEEARDVLPNCLKTEIRVTLNLHAWRNFFQKRAVGLTGRPHPKMLQITVPMLAEFKRLLPVIFEDLVPWNG